MKLSMVLTLAALETALAKPACPFSQWTPPGEGDVRGPCPMLNSLANHGFLPHSGKDFTEQQTVDGLVNALNIRADLARDLHQIAAQVTRNPNATEFSLSDLSKHNLLEHDASLSRQDFYFGDPQPFNKEVFDETRSYWTAPTVDVQMAANAMMARQATSNATNPDFELSELGDRFATGESAAYIIVLGDKVGGTVQRSVVEYLFENERLPTELGWSRPEATITGEDLGGMIDRVLAAAGRNSTSSSGVAARALRPGVFHVPRHVTA